MFTLRATTTRIQAIVLLGVCFLVLLMAAPAHAAATIPFTITLSEPVNVVTTGGTPRIAVDVGGVTRYATYASGTGTSALTFNYPTVAGDVDLDGITVSSPIQLNGGAIADLQGNPMTNLTFTPPNTSTVRVNYPSLGMDFVADADGRYTLNGTAYNDLSSFLSATGGSFTRNSVGTYFDSTGTLQTASANQPRFDHDPVTNARKGILIEENRTNLIKQSIDLKDSTWNGYCGAWATTYVPDPAGGNNAIRIPANSDGCAAYFSGILQCTNADCSGSNFPANTYTVSVWGRTVSGTLSIQIGNDDPNMGAPACTLTTSWQRCSKTITKSSTDIGNGPRVFQVRESTVNNQAYELFAPQVEVGAFATSYIPTTTAAVTRVADVLTMPSTAWLQSGVGTLFSDYQNGYDSFGGALVLEDSALPGENRVTLIRTSSAIIEALANSNNITQFQTGQASTGDLGINKSAVGYALNNFRQSTNGVLTALDTNGTPSSSLGQLRVGGWAGSGNNLNGWIRKAKYYPVRVPNAQLQLMTQ